MVVYENEVKFVWKSVDERVGESVTTDENDNMDANVGNGGDISGSETETVNDNRETMAENGYKQNV